MRKIKSILVTYDLRAPGRDYENLYTKIKKYPLNAKITESCWLIKTNDSCSMIYDNLAGSTDTNDRLFIVEISSSAVWKNSIADNEFLKANL